MTCFFDNVRIFSCQIQEPLFVGEIRLPLPSSLLWLYIGCQEALLHRCVNLHRISWEKCGQEVCHTFKEHRLSALVPGSFM